jgi:hypothetical protein
MKKILVTSTLALLAATWAQTAAAQGDEAVRAALAELRHEPSVAETVRVTLRYFRVDPENFDGLRSTARSRAWLPTLAVGYRFDDIDYTRFEQQRIFEPRENDESQAQRNNAITAGAIWDLRELVFNPAEVQVYGLIGVQRDLMLEVTRTYYLRRQLMLRLLLRPPEDPLALAALQMRVDEFTAILDVLSDGWFSEETNSRRRSGARRAGRR